MDGLASLAGLTGWMGNAIFSYLIFHFYRERGTRASIFTCLGHTRRPLQNFLVYSLCEPNKRNFNSITYFTCLGHTQRLLQNFSIYSVLTIIVFVLQKQHSVQIPISPTCLCNNQVPESLVSMAPYI